MTLDEEILFAKEEKEISKQVNNLMESLECNDNSMESLLNLKYSETAESLREFKYEEKIFEILKEDKKYDEISSLRKIISEAKNIVENSEDLVVVCEAYKRLAEAKVIIENTLTRAMKNGGSDLDKYQENTGSSDQRYERKARESIERKEKREMFKKAFSKGGEHLVNYQKKYNVSDEAYEKEAHKYANRK